MNKEKRPSLTNRRYPIECKKVFNLWWAETLVPIGKSNDGEQALWITTKRENDTIATGVMGCLLLSNGSRQISYGHKRFVDLDIRITPVVRATRKAVYAQQQSVINEKLTSLIDAAKSHYAIS